MLHFLKRGIEKKQMTKEDKKKQKYSNYKDILQI